MDGRDPAPLAPLARDARVDACIVGAGIAGMSTAYLLARHGLSVMVLDDGPVGGGETSRTSAHLSNAIDDRYVRIERLHGEQGARLAAESHTAAIDKIETICQQEGIECGFLRLDGFLFAPPGESTRLLDHELEATRRAGVIGVERLARAPLPSFDTGPCLRFPRQAQFQPLAYLRGLERAILADGGSIATGSHVSGIEKGEPAVVRTAAGPVVTAGLVVVATNSPVINTVVMHTKQAPYLTYVIGAPIPSGAVPRGLYWDTGDPYHFVRTHPVQDGEELLLVGGEDHKTGQAHDQAGRYARLEDWARERFPGMGQVRHRWSGQVLETIDGLAYIGRNPLDRPNVFLCTGDSGMGMTHGTIAGMIIHDLALGRTSPWAELYDPARKTLRAAGAFTRENVNVALQYGDWLAGSGPDPEGIAPGSGAVVRRGLARVALYRDEQGALHERSAKCPHLGCVVDWNAAAHTWDCPCHGSRFHPLGRVLNGPANADLGQVNGERSHGEGAEADRAAGRPARSGAAARAQDAHARGASHGASRHHGKGAS